MKVSISLDAQLLGLVDRLAANEGQTRSAVIERWLREGSRRGAAARLEEETAAYYDGLSPAEKDDDAVWAAAASKATKKLVIDEDPPSRGLPKAPPRSRPTRG
ncbi:MAG TPA: ribbon-helix-helix domain-containing protein [Polyangia bacterium]|nr:ribbon-helix-helix domain-containing protein [Polyangia bacterium]